jgi:ABC-type sugar transport system ATPase subunit
VMRQGEIVRELLREEATEENIVACATGLASAG